MCITGAAISRTAGFADAMRLVAAGLVEPIIDPRPLGQVVEAHRRQDAREICGRVVLIP